MIQHETFVSYQSINDNHNWFQAAEPSLDQKIPTKQKSEKWISQLKKKNDYCLYYIDISGSLCEIFVFFNFSY